MASPATRQRLRRFNYDLRDKVRQTARSKWQDILPQRGVDRSCLKDAHGPCPGCGGEDRFRFDDIEGRGTFYCNQRTPPAGDGFDLLQHVHGWSFPEALRQVADILGIDESHHGRSGPPATPAKCPSPISDVAPVIEQQPVLTSDPGKTQRIVGIVSGCGSITADGEVLRYLRGRRLVGIEDDLPVDLLQHPKLSYYDFGKCVLSFPAMVARLRDLSGELVGLHVTYVLDGAKAVGDNSKKMHSVGKGALRGAAVRLYEATDRVALTEGIENALAVRIATGWPVWAATSAGLLRSVQLPPSVREVSIWPDGDKVGVDAAIALVHRLLREGREVRLAIPPRPGMDALDWLMDEQGDAA